MATRSKSRGGTPANTKSQRTRNLVGKVGFDPLYVLLAPAPSGTAPAKRPIGGARVWVERVRWTTRAGALFRTRGNSGSTDPRWDGSLSRGSGRGDHRSSIGAAR